MKVCAAQIKPAKGDIEYNISAHIHWVEKAAAESTDLICFPELSLTGYEPTLAAELATTPGDERFAALQKASDQYTITIAAGLPLKAATGIQIGMLILTPGQPVQTYAKQLLHADELPFFTPGESQLIIDVNGFKIAPAICYESLQPDHAQEAFRMGAQLYLASVAKPERGIRKAYEHFPDIARRYAMPVVMANSLGPADNFMSAGQSAIWNREGEVIAQLAAEEEGLLYYNPEDCAHREEANAK